MEGLLIYTPLVVVSSILLRASLNQLLPSSQNHFHSVLVLTEAIGKKLVEE